MRTKIYTTFLEFSNSLFTKKARKFITAPFFLMLVASFALWYLAKLNYTYTTEIDVTIKVVDQKLSTTCVVEGLGTNLVGYRIYSGGVINVALSDVKFTHEPSDDDGNEYIKLDQDALNKMISVHCSDIKVISVEEFPNVEVSKKIRRELEAL